MHGGIDKAQYRIGPLTTYADPAELRRKFRRAGSGERIIYAVGPALSAQAPAAVLAREWQAEGLCHLVRTREPGGGGFRYTIEKRPGAATKANSVSAAASIAGRPEAQLLRVLAELADTGAAIPSLDLLAERAALPHRQAADYRLRLLVEGGFIAIRRRGAARYADILRREAAS